MDTRCLIRWMDTGDFEEVIIRSTEYDNDPDDDRIFFYGLSADELKALADTRTRVDEWEVLKVYDN